MYAEQPRAEYEIEFPVVEGYQDPGIIQVKVNWDRVGNLALDPGDVRALDRFEGHPFAYERVVKLVLDEQGRRRRVTTYLQPREGFEFWAPPQGYFDVLWRAYARLGFDARGLLVAAGVAQ